MNFSRTRIAVTLRLLPVTAQLTREPGSGQTPVTHHTLRRQPKDLPRFLDAESSEEPQLYNFGAARVDSCELFECVVQGAERGRIRLRVRQLIELDG